MIHNFSQPERLFVDRPVSSQRADKGHVSSLRLICQDRTDYTEAAVRFFLMLCIPVSLWLCGMQVSAISASSQTAPVQAQVWTAACLNPALPTAQIATSIR